MKHKLHLPRFLLASLCLHAVLVLPLTSAFQFAGPRETVLTVTLSSPLESNVIAAARSPSRAPRSAESAPTEAPVTASDLDETASTTVSPTDSSADFDEGTLKTELVRARIEAQLQIDLQRHFEYPPIARRKGWQGTVWLSYTIRPDGTLEQIEVDRSSGYNMLDIDAVSTMRRIERLAEAKHWLSGRSLSMNTPVLYRLKDR